MNIEKTKEQLIKTFKNELTQPEITDLANIFVSYSKRNTIDNDKKALFIWECIGKARTNLVALHGAKSTCGTSIAHELIRLSVRKNIRKEVEAAFNKLRAL